jgi:hypothetical protein
MNPSTAIPVKRTATGVAANVRVALWLSVAMIPLVAMAAAAGLLAPAIYQRNPATLIPALRGQDLVTLLLVPALGGALWGAWRGSIRATLIWIGLLGYMFYTYTGAAVGYYFAELTPLYIALFSLSVFALVAAASGIDMASIAERFDPATPRRAVASFLALIGLMLAGLWLGQIGAYLGSGVLPAGVVAAGGGPYFVYALDLGLIVPISVLGTIWLWQGRPWGFILASYLLVKATTMGLALLAMNWFNLRNGIPTEPVEQLGFYTLLALGGPAMAIWFFRHCRG